MRQEQRLRVLEPNASYDDRPAARRALWRRYALLGALCFALGAGTALLWAWHEWRAAMKPPAGKVYEHGEPVRR
ncbi:MAG: hypothetical protein ACHQ1G_07580 [Planctomycetota bacterium]